MTRILCASRAVFEQSLTALGFSGRVTTALIERFNLTLREHVAPLTRRTLTLARDLDSLALHLEWFRAYYHFFLPHDALRIPIAGRPGRYRKRTPAMSAGLA